MVSTCRFQAMLLARTVLLRLWVMLRGAKGLMVNQSLLQELIVVRL